MFDSNAMQELAHLSRDRYQRAGGGGAFKVYNTSKAYHDARGYSEMSPFRRAAYEAAVTFRENARNAMQIYAWDCRALSLDVDTSGNIPF